MPSLLRLVGFLAEDFRQALADFYYCVTDQPTPKVLRDRAIMEQWLREEDAANTRSALETAWHEDHFGAEQGWDWFRPPPDYYTAGIPRFEDQLSPWFRKNGVMLVPLGEDPPCFFYPKGLWIR